MVSEFFEKDLEDIIFENLDKVQERGFPALYKNTERQFYLPNGCKIDLMSWEIIDNVFYGKIIELKKDVLTESAFWQGCNYYCDFTCAMRGNFKNSVIELILVGKSFENNLINASVLSDFLKIYTYKYNWDGIFFECASEGKSFINDKFYNGNRIKTYDSLIEKLKGK